VRVPLPQLTPFRSRASRRAGRTLIYIGVPSVSAAFIVDSSSL